MIQKSPATAKPGKGAVIFALTLFVSIYWFLSLVINVYHYPVLGAVYEILWIGMVIALFGLPLFSFIFWIKNKFSLRSLYFYSFVISLASMVVLITFFS